eukprot:GCRY01000212.1.p1 GENE.GCRY01000212.1~~GCRY01000212.1.p1  ORF type:complete len:228 (-),score=25.58 GCRY01000212.1:129-812(-)
MMKTVLVTGASRGIGFEITKQYLEKGLEVIACCRKPTDQLQALKHTNLNIMGNVDVTNDESVGILAKQLAGRKIDILVNNAGLLHGDNFDSLNFDHMRAQYEVNTLGPLRVSSALIHSGSVQKGSTVAIVTSRMGSVQDNGSGGQYGYRASKSAVNAVAKSLSIDLKPKGIAILLLHPGYIRTDMTSHHGNNEPSEAASGIIEQIGKFALEKTGSFIHALTGEILPW